MKSAKCDTCKKDHYNMDANNPLGCTGKDFKFQNVYKTTLSLLATPL